MADRAVCPRCGEWLQQNEPECPRCAGQPTHRLLDREPVLFGAIILLLIGLWVATHYLTAAYEHRQPELARAWYEKGESEMRSGRTQQAVAALSTALAYSHDSFPARLKLAEALAAANRLREARAYFTTLWEQQPANATVNLELARLAVRSGDAADAIRHYHGAVYGVWDDNPVENRRVARLELIGFLLRHQARQQAESELIALAADLPRDPKLLVTAGDCFLQAGNARRALDEYLQAAGLDASNSAAAKGAGKAAFLIGDYAGAERYLKIALNVNPDDGEAAGLLHTAQLVLQMDPTAPRLSAEERTRRVLDAVNKAQSGLETCAKQRGMTLTLQFDARAAPGPLSSDYAQLMSLKPRLRTQILRAEPELIDTAMDLRVSV